MSTSKRKKEQRQLELKQKSALLKREKELKYARKLKKADKEFSEYVPSETFRRDLPKYESLKTTLCDTSKSEEKRYTGDYITGITIVHKSGLAPVSKGIDPKDYATMRR